MLIAVDKPKWMTSFDIIRALKRELSEKKIWHSWTLDPMATGLLLIGTSKDTKQLHHLTWLDKEYITTIDFSKMSDTRDMDYREIYNELDINTLNKPTIEQIKNKLDSIIPQWNLPLTPFSAKKKNWKKLYELARKGEQIIENKTMKISWYKIINYNFPTLELKLNVWSGTYVRSIWYWLWQQLSQNWKLGWILTSLRRISIQDHKLDNINLDQSATFFIKKDWENKWEIKFTYWII
jgi:tRNA pseudouridine55 synthase